MAQQAAQLPFQQQQAPVADLPADYMSAFQMMRDASGVAQPYMNAGANYMMQSANPITGAQIGNYLNPFANYVMGGLQDVFGQQMKQTTGSLTQAAGGVGADRIGVAQANLAKQQGLTAGQTLAGIYQPALNAAQQDAQRQQATGFGLGQLGSAAQTAAMAGAQGVGSIAEIQRQQAQQQLNAPYQLDLARIAHNYQIPQWLSGISAQTAPGLGGTTTNTYPAPSMLGQIAGLGMTAAGAFMGNPMMMGSGLKGTMGSQSMGMSGGNWGMGGWNPNVAGGYVYPRFARGGAVNRQDGGYAPFGDRFNAFADPLPSMYGPMPPEVPPPETPPNQSFDDRFGFNQFGAPNEDPRTAAAMEFGSPLPGHAAAGPMAQPTRAQAGLPPPPGPEYPPQFAAMDAEPPGEAMAYDRPRGAQPSRLPLPPMVGRPEPETPEDYPLPPDPEEGAWSRGPGAALMAAGLATLAASGKRDSRGLPMSPLAAIGEGGLEGLKHRHGQETQAQQRRRIDLEAKRLMETARDRRDRLAETKSRNEALERFRYDALDERAEQRRLDREDRNLRMTPLQLAVIEATRQNGGKPLSEDQLSAIHDRFQRRAESQALQQKIQALIDSGVSPTVAPGMVAGRYVVATDPLDGPVILDRNTGQRVNPSTGQPAGPAAGAPGAPARPSMTNLPPSSMRPDADYPAATGLSGAGSEFANRIVTALGGDSTDSGRSRATKALEDLQRRTMGAAQALVSGSNARPSNYLLQVMKENSVTPNSVFQGESSAKERLEQTRNSLRVEIGRIDTDIANKSYTTRAQLGQAQQARSQLLGLLSDYETVLKAWETGSQSPLRPIGQAVRELVPSPGAVREGAQGAAGTVVPPQRPKNVPPGSRPSRTRPGVWLTPQGQEVVGEP